MSPPTPPETALDGEQMVKVERRARVALVRLNRPDVRNALSPELMRGLADALTQLDSDRGIGCIVVAGSEQAFSAGADVGWLARRSHEQLMWFGSGDWPRIRAIRTPRIAAVSGWALGGGCELALSCDMVVASETARFGLPEIRLGIIPGAGGTQALARLAGRQRAMELILTGRAFDAKEAYELGLVSRLVPQADWLDAALELGGEVAERPALAARLAAEAVRAASSLPAESALAYERRLFELALATEDRHEGIAAFLEHRTANFPSLSPND